MVALVAFPARNINFAYNIRQWFEQQFKDLAEDLLEPFTGEARPFLQSVTSEEIERALKLLRNGGTTGPDGINSELQTIELHKLDACNSATCDRYWACAVLTGSYPVKICTCTVTPDRCHSK